ncbi:uncharacterized protein LOC132798576 [Drosophila nasuta]|uniref:uncharacterized protein LOC132798576 n=1 Tax=Drosophila nasuta TaxID=42062 RepID=UPI00295E4D68|nr:uncharacterized protein LOC132798576 [Drosophila nasuta]
MKAFYILLTIAAVGLGSVASATVPTSAAGDPQQAEYVDASDQVFASQGTPTDLPETVTAAISSVGNAFCSLSSPGLDECIRGLFQLIVPKLKTEGLQELNMGSIDPYFYQRGIFRYSNDGVQGGLLIKNMEINGISGLKVNTVATNFTNNGFVIKLGLELPKLKAGGQFKADVKFGGLRLVPKGPFNITIDNVKATVLTDGHIEDLPNGSRRLSLHRLNANVNVGSARVLANGIFSDRNLNAMILNLVNENLPEITRVGIPATREQWAPILVTHINEFFAPVPIEKLLVQ